MDSLPDFPAQPGDGLARGREPRLIRIAVTAREILRRRRGYAMNKPLRTDRFRQPRILSAVAGTALALGPFAASSLANPRGGQVLAGRASITQNGSLTQITASNNAILSFQSFNIARNETVQFIQPSASSRVLSRIDGSAPSFIEGSLFSNGRVYLINP